MKITHTNDDGEHRIAVEIKRNSFSPDKKDWQIVIIGRGHSKHEMAENALKTIDEINGALVEAKKSLEEI
jgi:hypothetical protein